MKILDEPTLAAKSDNAKGALDAETARLASLIDAHTSHDGSYGVRIPGLYVNRYSRIEATDYVHTINLPAVGIAAQGKKVMTVGKEVYEYSGARIFIAPVTLPVAMKTIQASPTEPFLGVGLYLDPQRIAELVPKVFPQGLPEVRNRSAGYVINADTAMINAVARLVDCLSHPGDDQLLAPLVKDEIYIRLLRSPIGVYVAETVFSESGVQRIVKAIDWLQNNFPQQLKIADLAEMVHMSESSFREHFKSVTAMSPLQYQKALRLQEARRLMLSSQMDATTASRFVGYLSDTQFNRDYSRFFGSPPSRDIARWRQERQHLK
ncbi:AraC family transcriptional regulator [Cohnella sp. REN36]|uniref:AraC family transcriptional regulator n=1 Tax=Cohnella sp. REN36 TaxID=2887347 RepID=UPI001D15159C|nr:AraC family transcriptional regulator [Cohnella sp. REN36]MCC3372112.1 AraC family transcriptional regulator [Cohnella sp. REN36]